MSRSAILILTGVSALLLASAAGCGSRGEASATVVAFAEALEDSDYPAAWEMLTLETRERYETAASVLREFGWLEVDSILAVYAPGIDEETFAGLDGYALFEATVSVAPQTTELSTSVKSVSYPDSSLAIVVLRTEDGLQEVEVRRDTEGGAWLVDLTTLEPPLQEIPEQ